MAEQRKKNRISFLTYPTIRGGTVGSFLPSCDSETVSLVSEPSPVASPLSASSCTRGRGKNFIYIYIHLLLKNNSLKSVHEFYIRPIHEKYMYSHIYVWGELGLHRGRGEQILVDIQHSFPCFFKQNVSPKLHGSPIYRTVRHEAALVEARGREFLDSMMNTESLLKYFPPVPGERNTLPCCPDIRLGRWFWPVSVGRSDRCYCQAEALKAMVHHSSLFETGLACRT